jgi:hypothetical protein
MKFLTRVYIYFSVARHDVTHHPSYQPELLSSRTVSNLSCQGHALPPPPHSCKLPLHNQQTIQSQEKTTDVPFNGAIHMKPHLRVVK